MSSRVLDVDNVERSRMAFTMTEDTNTTNVTSGGNHDQVSSIEFDVIGDLASGQVQNNGVVDLNME